MFTNVGRFLFALPSAYETQLQTGDASKMTAAVAGQVSMRRGNG